MCPLPVWYFILAAVGAMFLAGLFVYLLTYIVLYVYLRMKPGPITHAGQIKRRIFR